MKTLPIKPKIPNDGTRSHYYIGKNRYYIWYQKDEGTGNLYYFRETKVKEAEKKIIACILLAVALLGICFMSSYEPLSILTFLSSIALLIAAIFVKRIKIVETNKEEYESATASYTMALKSAMNQ